MTAHGRRRRPGDDRGVPAFATDPANPQVNYPKRLKSPALRSLGRAQAALDRAQDDTPTPPWLLFVNDAELDGLAAIAFNALGRYDKAEDIAVRDLQVMPATFARNRVHVVLHLAEARLGCREIEQGARDAGTALDLARQMRAGLQTGRVASRLRGVRRQLDRWSQVPVARDWVDAYDRATTAA